MDTVELFAKAFQLWEEGFRAEPSNFMTAEQSAEMGSANFLPNVQSISTSF